MPFLPSRASRRAQRAQARLQVLVTTHDSTAALVDEELDLEVDRGAFVVGAQPEIAPIAHDQLAARERVADLGRGAAVDVGPVEHRDHPVGAVDRRPIGRADLAVQRPPRVALLGPVRQPLDRIDLRLIRQRPGVEHLVPEARHERDEHRAVEMSPGLGEAQWARHVDPRRGRHRADRISSGRRSPARSDRAPPGADRSTSRSAQMTLARSLSAAVAVLVTLTLTGPVTAQEFVPAVVFDMGGKFDKSFNEAAYNGAERFKKETGIAYREFEVTAEAQREQALRNMARRGAHVVVGIGFSQATGMEKVAKDKGRLAIGVDSNQNHLHPGTILTSMVKRVDLAVYESFKAAKDGTWKSGVRILGVAEGGVGYAIDQNNRSLITPEMEKRLEQARADIVAGKLKVTDYTAK